MAEGKEVREFDGEIYVMERGADRRPFASSRRGRAIAEGNLVYRKTARNFNPMMATAGKVTVAEVEELVPVGALDRTTSTRPASSSTASSRARSFEKRIERVTTRPRANAAGSA